MSLHTGWIRYGENGRHSGYAARPAGVKQPLPAVIVLQEIWGVDDHIQDVTRRLAKAGFVAFAPDLFAKDGSREDELGFERIEAAKRFLNSVPQAAWRNPEERKSALSRLPEEQQRTVAETLERIFDLRGRFAEFKVKIAAAAAFLRRTYSYSAGQGVAVVGFCMGGALSGTLAAADAELRGAAVFYGNPPSPASIPFINCPVIGFYGELDRRITEEIPEFARQMNEAGKSFEYHIYPDALHAFFNDSRPSYHVSSARDSYIRLLSFLQRVLN